MSLEKALISLRICAGWSEPLLVAHTTLLEISCHSSYIFSFTPINKRLCIAFPLELLTPRKEEKCRKYRNNIWYNKTNITFPERVIVENEMLEICALVDNHIPWDDISDYYPIRECNIYIIHFTSGQCMSMIDDKREYLVSANPTTFCPHK